MVLFPKGECFLKLEGGFFSSIFFFSQIFKNTPNLSYLYFISVNLKINQRTFFDQEVGREGGSSLLVVQVERAPITNKET